MRYFLALIMGLMVLAPQGADAATLDGASLSPLWALPFAGLLLSIAAGPVFFHHAWEHHYGKITAGWVALILLPMAVSFGLSSTFEAALHAILYEYISFIVLLFALYTISGGIVLKGTLKGTPLGNGVMMLVGMVMASFVGTTGAAMILIRPLIRANDQRPYNTHVVVFFIFLVANIGGALTPLGDPPLFVGFLRGVEFFWTTQYLWKETLLVGGLVFALFLLIDSYFYRKEPAVLDDPTPPSPLAIDGKFNFVLLAGVIGMILLSASWKPGLNADVAGGTLALQNVLRDVALLGLAWLSLKLTPQEHRLGNGFHWGPIQEVAKLFLGIFLTMIPVLAMLKAGQAGAFAPLVALVTAPDGSPNPFAYFWMTGLLSAFLDNAPTYLVFFELAGGDAKTLMGPLSTTLMAISTGAVYMGAMSYIGNAPNFMVYAIAKHRGIRMPSFFGYLIWSSCLLLPVLALASWVFFLV